MFDRGELLRADKAQDAALGKELLDEAVGVFVVVASPKAVGIAVEDVPVQFSAERLVPRPFRALDADHGLTGFQGRI